MATFKELFKLDLKDYQEKGAKYALLHHYCVIGDRMGLGKTPQGIAVSLKTGSKTLVVCPADLRLNWEHEFYKFAKKKPAVAVIESSKDLENLHLDLYRVVIISYAMVKKCRHLFEWCDLVLADEAHYLKNINAVRTKHFHLYLYETEPERCVFMTGTPVENRVKEWFSLLALCSYNPKFTSGIDILKHFEDEFQFACKFSRRFTRKIAHPTKKGKIITINKFKGIRNIRKLKKLLSGKYIRRTEADVEDLPEYFEKEIIIDYKDDPALMDEWEEFNDENTGTSSKTKALSALKKAPFVGRYCDDLLEEGEGPLLVFSDHLKPIESIRKHLHRNKWKVKVIDGSVPAKDRQPIVDAFQNGELDAIIWSITCAKGYNAQAAKNVIFNDESWIPTRNDQARKRAHRMGLDHKITFHYPIGSKQDKDIRKMNNEKLKVLEKAV